MPCPDLNNCLLNCMTCIPLDTTCCTWRKARCIRCLGQPHYYPPQIHCGAARPLTHRLRGRFVSSLGLQQQHLLPRGEARLR